MESVYHIKGHVTPNGTIIGDESVPLPAGPVELTVRAQSERRDFSKSKSILEILDLLPPGNRTKEDIDAQLKIERDSWERT